MHSRMRHRVAEFLKVLNRAKPEQAEKERKTARWVSLLYLCPRSTHLLTFLISQWTDIPSSINFSVRLSSLLQCYNVLVDMNSISSEE